MNFANEKSLMGLKIKNFRRNMSFTQEQLCEELGIDVSGLSKIENGKCFPSVETVCKLMRILKIEPNKLFDFVECDEFSIKAKNDIFLEKVKLLSEKDKQKILKFIQLLKE